MFIKTEEFDLESISATELVNLFKEVESIDLNKGYSRSDLESIESKLTGAFTDVEDFDFREIPSAISKVNSNLISRRIYELRELIGRGINNRYHTYIALYGNLIAEFNGIRELLSRHKDHTPSPVVSDLDIIHLYESDFDHIKLTNYNFAKDSGLYTKIRALRDDTLNIKVNTFNYLIPNILCSQDCLITSKKEYQYSILKKVLNSTEIKYDNVVGVFSNSNDLLNLIDKTNVELLKVLTELKELMDWDYINDSLHQNWVTGSAKLDKFTALAEDRHSLQLLQLIAVIRYFDNYSELDK